MHPIKTPIYAGTINGSLVTIQNDGYSKSIPTIHDMFVEANNKMIDAVPGSEAEKYWRNRREDLLAQLN